jgi:hypothetical protein
VLFYEKLDPEEEYERSKSFKLTSHNQTELTKLSTESDMYHSNNFENIYGPETIEK